MGTGTIFLGFLCCSFPAAGTLPLLGPARKNMESSLSYCF